MVLPIGPSPFVYHQQYQPQQQQLPRQVIIQHQLPGTHCHVLQQGTPYYDPSQQVVYTQKASMQMNPRFVQPSFFLNMTNLQSLCKSN